MATNKQIKRKSLQSLKCNKRSYSFSQMCFEKWATHLLQHKYYHLKWKLIKADLSKCVQSNKQLRQQIFICTPSDITFPTENEAEIYRATYHTINSRNENIFDARRSLIHFILFSDYSPLSLLLQPKQSRIKCTEFGTNLKRMKDSLRILQLLTTYDILSGEDTSDDIRRALNKLDKKQTKYRNKIMAMFIDTLVLMSFKSNWQLIGIKLDEDIIRKNAETAENTEEQNYLSYHYYTRYTGWPVNLCTRTDIIERLLFRAIKPFEVVIESENEKNIENKLQKSWYELLDESLQTCDMNNVPILSESQKKNLEALISPFTIYPFFKRATNKMFDLLNECIPMNQDCVSVILEYLYCNDIIYGNYYNKYSSHLLSRAIEFLIYIKSVDNIGRDKYFQTQIFNERFDDPELIQFIFKHFEKELLKSMDLLFCRQLLLKYKSECILSIRGYHNILSRVIDKIMFYGNSKKYDFQSFMQILSTPLLTTNDIGLILNYSDESSHTLLTQVIDAHQMCTLQKNEMKIIDSLLKRKETNITVINLGLPNLNRPNAFHCAIWNCRTILCSKLLKTESVPVLDVCNAIDICMKKKKWKKGNRCRIVALKIGLHLTNYVRKNPTRCEQKQMVTIKRTMRNIRRYLRKNPRMRNKKTDQTE